MTCVCAFFIASALSCSIAKQGYDDATLAGKERELKTTLSLIRKDIQAYTTDNGRPPSSLNHLVKARYINEIPRDPFTEKSDWALVWYDCHGVPNCAPGIRTLHSASNKKAVDGSFYKDW